MQIINARFNDKPGLWSVRCEQGLFSDICAMDANPKVDSDAYDAREKLLVSPFVEPHIHLDATQTAGQPNWNLSGTLFEGIERWAERKNVLNIEDVKARAHKTLSWQIANGIQHVRTHVDVSDPSLMALHAMLEVKQEIADYIDLQIVAFPQEGILSYPNGKALMRQAMELGADVVGAIPHFEYTREYGVESLHFAIELALEYEALVDVHCDEIDDEQSRFVETLACLALEHQIGHRVTASHTTAMHSYNNAYASRLFRLLKRSGISFVANPLVNTHLQGRFDSYPKRRGVTRVKEMLDANINVCFGHDDVFDPWYPLGTANMLQVLHMGLHVCQIMGFEQINQGLRLISEHSAKALNLSKFGITQGLPASFLLLNASNGFDALRRQAEVVLSVRKGIVIAKTEPAHSEILGPLNQQIDFR